jgi:hypothetical protein
VNWQREKYGFRGAKLAESLGAVPLRIFKKSLLGWPLSAPVRYAFQSIETFRRLWGLRARSVIVQTPPWPLTATVWVYAKLFGARFVTDNHTSTFGDPRWKRFNFIDRFFSRRAVANLAHNHKNLEILRKWNAQNPMMVLSPALWRHEIYDETAELPGPIDEAARSRSIKVLMVNRFAVDDCWRQVFDAARLMPDAQFFVTGDPAHAGTDVEPPQNAMLTGFLARPVFIRLMDSCDVVLTLTSRPDTLLWAIRECLALGKPFVATGNDVVRANFEGYGLFTDNSAEDIAAKLAEAHARREEFVPRMAQYIENDKRRWDRDMDAIDRLLK